MMTFVFYKPVKIRLKNTEKIQFLLLYLKIKINNLIFLSFDVMFL